MQLYQQVRERLLFGREIGFLLHADTKHIDPSVMKVWVTLLGQKSQIDELLAEGKYISTVALN